MVSFENSFILPLLFIGKYIGFDEFIVEMEISLDFRSGLIQILREVDFETYRVRVLDVDQKTKLIFENMPQLIHQQPDVKTFSSYWDRCV